MEIILRNYGGHVVTANVDLFYTCRITSIHVFKDLYNAVIRKGYIFPNGALADNIVGSFIEVDMVNGTATITDEITKTSSIMTGEISVLPNFKN